MNEQTLNLNQAITIIGGPGKFNDVMGTTYGTLKRWREKGVPLGKCAKIEIRTKGKITRAMLRPEHFGPLSY